MRKVLLVSSNDSVENCGSDFVPHFSFAGISIDRSDEKLERILFQFVKTVLNFEIGNDKNNYF